MSPVRVITAADIPGAMRLKEAAGWNQTEADWRHLLALAPDGCFGIEVEGRLAATTTAVCFGPALAWIGMVLTHPDDRGRGLARRLMEHALAYLEGRADWIKLDATDMGRPLYQKLGFVDEAPIERWAAAASEFPREPELPAPAMALDMDRQATGADRTALLNLLVKIEAAGTAHGFAMGRPGSQAAYFGPCVARSADEAQTLARWFRSRHAGETVYWDVLPENADAVRIARACGFAPLRKLVRMALPGRRKFPHDDRLVYAIAGFEYG